MIRLLPRARIRYSLLLLPFLLLATARLWPQPLRSRQWYDDQSKRAIGSENYETAVKILKEAIGKYSDAVLFNLRLADLYYEKELYHLAKEEYLAANDKAPGDFHTLNRLQRCLGFLNQNYEAVKTLEDIVSPVSYTHLTLPTN